MLRFLHLQDSLRKLILDRIAAGELTGMALAASSGFRQAHISNFLNRKRGLSLEGMDRVLEVEKLSVLDLVPPEEINRRASIPPPREDDYANIFFVSPENSARAQVQARDVLEVLKFKHAFLRRLRPSPHGDRENWLRFVITKPSRSCGEAMFPRLAPGCTVLLDRHYTALVPYRRAEPCIYAVVSGNEVIFRKVEFDRDCLLLRPEHPAVPIKRLHVSHLTDCRDLIVGRVVHVSMET